MSCKPYQLQKVQSGQARPRTAHRHWLDSNFSKGRFSFQNGNEKVAARLMCHESWKHTLATVSKSTFFRCLSATSPGASTRTKQTRLYGTLIVSPARVMEQCLRTEASGLPGCAPSMHSSRRNSRLLSRRTKGRMQVKVSTRRLRQSVPIQHLPTALGLAFYQEKGPDDLH